MKAHEILKIKLEWFEILEHCSPALRSDVIEAVMQYFFRGILPNFTDEARMIAFGFIRCEIDAKRKNRPTHPTASTADANPAPETSPDVPTEEETYMLDEIVCTWNEAVDESCISSVEAEEINPESRSRALHTLREHGKEKVIQVIRTATDLPFLNGLALQGLTIDFDWLFHRTNFDLILGMVT